MSDPVTRLNAALQGRYRIERELGQGGMATVYLADDLKHERKVALKVLKPELAAVVGAERFLAEIKTTANLQHPHILPLFDSGEADTYLFYVMPYVEGETLKDRLDREHQLPVDEAVQIATAVANALDYAHRHGVIHRDIKPANLLIHDGQPVISDFGIALAVGTAGQGRLTETGLSVGTPHYMSPEQATGDQTVGVATDIYALGAVLYEMLVGDPPYTGSTAQAILGKIIAGKSASATEQRASVPRNVDAAIRKSLEKLPADRFVGAQDFSKALGDPGFRHGEDIAAGIAAGRARWKPLALAASVLALVSTVGFGWALLRSSPTPEELGATRRFEIEIGPTRPIPVSLNHAFPLLSPDGTVLAFSAVLEGDGVPRLYVRRLDQLEARVLPGTENAYAPFFSPDGQWIAYQDPLDRVMRKVSVQGGQPIDLTDAWPPLGGTWLEDGTIIYTSQEPGRFTATGEGAGLFRVSDAGGVPERLTTVDGAAGESVHAHPHVLPGGEAVVFTSLRNLGQDGTIMALILETGERRTLIDVGSQAQYAPSGHLVFTRGGALWSTRFDPVRLDPVGQPVVVLQGVEITPASTTIGFSPDGLMAYMPGVGTNVGAGGVPRTLVWVDRTGGEEPLPLPTRTYLYPKLSPDGRRVAVAVFDGQGFDLRVFDVRSGATLQLTFDGTTAVRLPVWSTDGERIYFRSVDPNTGFDDLFWVASDGSGDPEQLTATEAQENPTGMSPDGRTLIFSRVLGEERVILGVELEGEPAETTLIGGGFLLGNATLSPDGRWLAYFSDESGQLEIYVQPYPGPGPKTPVSIGGGDDVQWSRDGSELFYRNGDAYMAVSVESGPPLSIGEPRTLFRGSYLTTVPGGGRQYDVAPDGRFLMIKEGDLAEGEASDEYDHLVVVENWFDELRRLLPAN